MSDELFTAVRGRDREKVLHILKQQPQSATARDADGATPLHYAAESYDRDIVEALLAAGADVNARDLRFGATPAGWAIEYLRQAGALLGIEIEDAADAIAKGDERLVKRYLTRFPALVDAVDKSGTPLKELARKSPSSEVARRFGG
jgi:hypothetical protein